MEPKIFFISLLLLINLSLVRLPGQTSTQPDESATRVRSCDLKNLFKVNDSIYRSEQPGKAEFACLEKETRIRSVLNLRAHHLDSILIRGSSLKPFTVEMSAKKPANNEIIEALRILKSAPKPILVHCAHGRDRTGLVIAMYRIYSGRRTKKEALEELKTSEYQCHKKYFKIYTNYIDTVDMVQIKRMVDK
jgi:tyrosine-protein phosphatase SIW14